jgi:signal transduction histidine kinase
VGYGELAVPALVRARTAPQLALMLALAAVMAAAVLLVALSAAREVRLADLKSDFVSSVSHDLKTPLALIQLFAETLEVGRIRTPERAQEYYRIINSEAQKLTRLINNILEFSRIEAGLRHYRLSPVNLADLASKVLSSLEHQFKQNRFEVTSNLAGDLPPISVDAEAVARALENLLSNAMKYSGDAREIRVEVVADRGAELIRVSDKGIGIPRRYQRRIFRKFYRVRDGDGLAAQGSGLGLAIVEHVMEAHKGAVHVVSEPGRGSTFTLWFPMRAAAEYPEAGWP